MWILLKKMICILLFLGTDFFWQGIILLGVRLYVYYYYYCVNIIFKNNVLFLNKKFDVLFPWIKWRCIYIYNIFQLLTQNKMLLQWFGFEQCIMMYTVQFHDVHGSIPLSFHFFKFWWEKSKQLTPKTGWVIGFHRFFQSHAGFNWFNCTTDLINSSNRSYHRFMAQPVRPVGPSRILKLCFPKGGHKLGWFRPNQLSNPVKFNLI